MKKVGSVLALLGVLSLIGSGLLLLFIGMQELFPKVKVVEAPVMAPAPVECMKFNLMSFWPETGEFMVMAETELCGQGLAWQDRAFGPSLTNTINELENEVAAWRDCAESRLLCADWQLEEIKGSP